MRQIAGLVLAALWKRVALANVPPVERLVDCLDVALQAAAEEQTVLSTESHSIAVATAKRHTASLERFVEAADAAAWCAQKQPLLPSPDASSPTQAFRRAVSNLRAFCASTASGRAFAETYASILATLVFDVTAHFLEHQHTQILHEAPQSSVENFNSHNQTQCASASSFSNASNMGKITWIVFAGIAVILAAVILRKRRKVRRLKSIQAAQQYNM